ncbi:hypothetical protein JTB14_020537 [Gonioctena quinquepunctata]|nr:hypothetical protein JTB14_020537 [Gonioctena quinquepunctata]
MEKQKTDITHEKISNKDLQEAGPSNNLARQLQKSDSELLTEVSDYETDNPGKGGKVRSKRKKPNPKVDIAESDEQSFARNIRRADEINQEITKAANRRCEEDSRVLEELYGSIRKTNMPLQDIMLASIAASKKHWTDYYTKQREKDLEDCRSNLRKCTNLNDEARKMLSTPEESDWYHREFPEIHQNEFKPPKRTTKSGKLKQGNPTNEVVKTSNKYSVLSNEAESNTDKRETTKGGKTARPPPSNPTRKQPKQNNMMPAIVVIGMLQINKAIADNWTETLKLEDTLLWKFNARTTVLYTYTPEDHKKALHESSRGVNKNHLRSTEGMTEARISQGETNKRLRERLDKTLGDLDRSRKEVALVESTRGKYISFEQEKEKNAEIQRLRDDIQKSSTSNQQLESKLHELTIQLDLARQEVAKVSSGQDKQHHELERAVIECEKLRDRYEKLKIHAEKLEKENERLRSEFTQVERRQTLASDKVRNDERVEIERLKEKLEKAFQARDATELEAGRLAQELEKSQQHLANALQTNEATKIEFERMANELARMHERIERDQLDWKTMEQERDVLRAELQQIRTGLETQRRTFDHRSQETVIKLQQELAQVSRERDKMANMLDKQGRQGESVEKQIIKYEADIKQLTMERDQLVMQLEKSQDMLMNFQQELNHSEAELEKQKAEVARLKAEQKKMGQDMERGTKDILDNRDKEIAKLQQQLQALQKERETHRQRADKAEKLLHESGARGDSELEQWRKVVQQETDRADQAEKAAQDLQKRIQVMEKQLQQQLQQMAQYQKDRGIQPPPRDDKEIERLRRELEKSQAEVKNSFTEKERLQAQLEMLVQELERNQLELHEAHKKAAAAPAQKPGEDLSVQKRQIDEEKRMVDEAKKQIEEHRRAVDNKSRQAGGNAAAMGELNKKLAESEKKMEQAQEEAKRSATEMERLLQLVQMSQEEQNTKEKQIADLQQALKNAQMKLKSQQQQQAQKEEEHQDCNSSEEDNHENESKSVDPNVHDLKCTLSSFEEALKENKREKEILETTLEGKNDAIVEYEKIYRGRNKLFEK